MELFVTKNGMGDGNVLDEEQNRRDATVLKLRTPRSEWNRKTVLLLRMERNGTGWNRTRTERLNERNGNRHNLSEGPCSRTERN